MDNTIGDRIKKIRIDSGLSQDAFAESLGMKRNSITLIETGKRNASARTKLDICLQYRIELDWLENGKGPMYKSLDRAEEIAAWAGTVVNPSSDDSFMQKFVYALTKLDESDWEALEKFINTLINEYDDKKDGV